jgi:hypothetical protein
MCPKKDDQKEQQKKEGHAETNQCRQAYGEQAHGVRANFLQFGRG